MTVAVAVKVFDGIVLAADSATTLPLDGGSAQVYNSANKVFHLHRRYPIGAMTWGLGSIGSASISTFTKDLRRRLMGKDPDHLDWELNDGYTVEQVAGRLIEMIYDDVYLNEYKGAATLPSALGFLVAGYSGQGKQAEGWQVIIQDPSQRPSPTLAIPYDSSGWAAFAQPDAALRLFNGFDPALPAELEAILDKPSWEAVQGLLLSGRFQRQPVVASMPFGDAISLARFIVDVTVGYSRYLLGPDTVGGPVEVAGINRHEGFKWISRKHYYRAELNPEEPRHAY